MNAPRERRHGRRCASVYRLGFPVWLLLSACCRGGPDPSPPDPARSDPDPPPVAVAPDPLPDTPPAPAAKPAPAAPAALAAPADAVERPASPPGLLTPPPDEPDPRLDAEFKSRRSLNHILYRDRRYRLLLDEAAQLLQRGESLAAFDLLIEVTSAGEDVFLWDAASSRPVSARQSGADLLRQLSPADQARFERYAGTAADTALGAALSQGDFTALTAVARLHPTTTAGRRAARLVASQLVDAGRAAEAAALWRLVLQSPGRDELPPADLARAALVAALTQDAELAALAVQDSAVTLNCDGTAQPWSICVTNSAQDWTSAQTAAPLPGPHWTTPAGASSGQRSDPGTAPYHIPVWSAAARKPETSHAASPNPVTQLLTPSVTASTAMPDAASLHQWLQTRLDDGEPPATAALPIVCGETIIVRDERGLVARDLASGAPCWRHDCATALDGTSSDPTTDVATPGYTQVCAENALLLALTSDGQRVYFLDHVAEAALEPIAAELAAGTAAGDAFEEPVATQVVNRLIALRLPANIRSSSAPSAAAEVAWSLGGSGSGARDRAPLDGHFFLGPPLPVGRQLLVLSEARGQIHLSGLDATTGAVEFTQGLSLVDRAVTLDTDRLRLAFLPAVQDGLAVCPTPSGALIAFDLTTRSLAWTAQYRALDTSISTSWRGDGRAAATLFPVQPVLAAGRALMLPPDSVELLAFELSDGARAWSLPRRGGHQVVVTPQDTALLVSTDRVTCCDIAAGEVAWERSVESICGRGVLVGGSLFAPQQQGQLLRLDAATGRTAGGGPEILSVVEAASTATAPLLSRSVGDPLRVSDTATPRHQLGNLIVAGQWIVSASPLETAAFVQSEPLLAAARAPTPAGDNMLATLVQSWSPHERCLRVAELELTLGRGTAALPHLQALVTDATVAPQRPRAVQLLRELLYSRLEAGAEAEPDVALAQLAQLADTPLERARWQVGMLRQAAAEGDDVRWRSTATLLTALPSDLLVPVDVARSLQFAPAVVIDRSRERLLQALASDRRIALTEQLSREWTGLSTVGDAASVSQFIRIAGNTRAGDTARLHLSRLLQDSGCKLAAEQCLLPIERHADSTLGGQKQRALANLARQRRPSASGTFAGAVVATDFVPARRPAAHPLLESPADFSRVAFRIEDDAWSLFGQPRVEVQVHTPTDDVPAHTLDLSAVADYRRELAGDPGSRLRVINLGDYRPAVVLPAAANGEAPESTSLVELAIVRRESAAVESRVLVPVRSREPQWQFQPEAGHFLPLADHEVHGLSLLDGQKLWTVTPPGGDRSDRVRLGPNGPGYCIVQTTGGVCCLDPVTGDVRWQRRDVPADAGLYAHEDAGILGDARHLAIFEADQRTCRIVSTATGELLTTTALPTHNTRWSRFVFGSRLLFVADVEGVPHVRLWDAATQSVLFEEPACLPVRHYRVDRRHAAFVAANGDVVVLDTRHAAEVLRHRLDPAWLPKLTNLVSVWSDSERWYIHTQHAGLPVGGGRSEAVASDVLLPAVQINGLLSAYQRADRRHLWTETFESRTLLLEPTRPLPFLVTLWRPREGMPAASSGLTLELIDKRTGQVLSQTTDIAKQRFVHAALREEAGEYELYSETARISIRYTLAAPRQMMTAENDAELLTP